MNLNASPMKEELRKLIAACDDRAADHVLWVDARGEVHISRVPNGSTPAGLLDSLKDVRLRYETFEKGNDYVGPSAAADDEWMSCLLSGLLKEWPNAKEKSEVEYVSLC